MVVLVVVVEVVLVVLDELDVVVVVVVVVDVVVGPRKLADDLMVSVATFENEVGAGHGCAVQ